MGADPPPTEYELKAAFLYHFATFVEWPPEAFDQGDDRLILGVLGEDPFGSLLDEVVQDQIVGDARVLTIQRFDSVQAALRSHVLFISSSESRQLPQILDSLQGTSILTVGEMERFAERGGMIGLWAEGKRVRFDINLQAARKGRLSLSSQLLKLARIVDGDSSSKR